jgi:hypothetical protein
MAYVSYADSLQQGDIAPAGTLNAGEGLAPYRSKQEEVGYKVELGRLDLMADVFRIKRPYPVVAADNIFEIQAEQVNDGVELSARGAATDDLLPAGQDAMTYFFNRHEIDISLGYCSSRSTAPDPSFTTVELSPELAVTADYGLSVLGHREAALRFALFVMSPEAQHLIGLYGFMPVAQSRDAVYPDSLGSGSKR